MHDTAFRIGTKFIEIYATPSRRIILEIGSQDINGSLRDACPHHCLYLGLDVEPGKGVDIVIDPIRPIPIRADFSDLTISSSQMEHDPKFWATFLELCRVTKEDGLIYLSVPSNGNFHSFPIDAWRFYPDAGRALAAFARECGFEITLLESFTASREADIWNDFVAIFYKGQLNEEKSIAYLADEFNGQNAWKLGSTTMQNVSLLTQDQTLLIRSINERHALLSEVELLKARLTEMESLNGKIAEQLASAEVKAEQDAAAHTTL